MTRERGLDALAASLAGLRIPGGCEDCDAYQTFAVVGAVYEIHVHHDRTCPTYLQHRNRQ